MLRIGFFGQSGPYAPPAFRYLISRAERYRIVLTVEGTRAFGGRARHELVQPARAALPPGDNLAAISRASGIPALKTSDINSMQAVRVIEEHRIDWIACVGFDRLFKPPVLAAARCGGVNAHPSPLPRLRGPAPIFWAVREGWRDSAVTLHALDRREDHGPVFAQQSFLFPRRASGSELFRLAGGIAGQLLHELFESAERGRLSPEPQAHGNATRAPRPRPEDARVDPLQWTCEHLVDFACVAPFNRAAWMKLGDETFFARRGLGAEIGRQLPAQYVLRGRDLILQCKDGIAYLEVQA